jgi:hypothetical protein
MIKLFIDDERFPPNDGTEWIVVRSSAEAKNFVKKFGIPDFISFDHDLGGEDTSIVFINWLTDELIEGRLQFPTEFQYYVHSQNPVGVKNIESKMNQLLKHFNTGS